MHKPIDTPTEDMTWNQTRFNKRRMAQRVLAHRLVDSELMQPGFLLTHGDKGRLLIGPIFHNGDFYRRHCQQRGTVYGSITALLEGGMAGAEILTAADLLRAALEQREFLRVERESDSARLDPAMLHPWPTDEQPRSCAIWLDSAGRLQPLNPENPARYNQPPSRFRIVEILKDAPLETALRRALEAGT